MHNMTSLGTQLNFPHKDVKPLKLEFLKRTIRPFPWFYRVPLSKLGAMSQTSKHKYLKHTLY